MVPEVPGDLLGRELSGVKRYLCTGTNHICVITLGHEPIPVAMLLTQAFE